MSARRFFDMTADEIASYRGPVYWGHCEALQGTDWVPHDIDEPTPEAVDEVLRILAQRYRVRNIRRGERLLDHARNCDVLGCRAFHIAGISINDEP